jgi:electron transfer flavoprotein alpha subunit
LVASFYDKTAESSSIWVFLEHDQAELSGVTKELLTKAHQMTRSTDWDVVGLLMGQGVGGLQEQAFRFGADEVWLLEHPLLEQFTVDAYTAAVQRALEQGKPSVFLCGATPNGRDLAGRLAVRLRTGLNADCTDLRLDEKRGVLISEVTGFGGGVLALLECPEHRPQMATVRPGVFVAQVVRGSESGRLTPFEVQLERDQIRTRVRERVHGESVDLTQAEVLVCGGRGVEGDFELMQQLADLLGGDVGATRPPVDEGYVERERQVGQTGVVCRPKVAFACGISGAFHFVVGIQDAELVIAVNTDPEAPMFDYADYCIVEDARRFISELIQVLEEERVAADA